jgi:hypothetical protein
MHPEAHSLGRKSPPIFCFFPGLVPGLTTHPLVAGLNAVAFLLENKIKNRGSQTRGGFLIDYIR